MVGVESALAGVHAHHRSGERVAQTGRDRVDGWIQEEERGENQQGRDDGAVLDDEARELEGGGLADVVLGYFGHGVPALVESNWGGRSRARRTSERHRGPSPQAPRCSLFLIESKGKPHPSLIRAMSGVDPLA